MERKRWEVGRSQGVYWVGEQLATTWNKGRGCPVQLLFPKLTLKQPFIFAASSASGPERPLAIFLSLLGGSAATTVMCFNSPIAHWRFSLPRNALPVATLHGSPAFKALLLDSCPHPVAFVSWPFFLHFFFNPSILVYLILWAVKWGLTRLHLQPSYWSQCGFPPPLFFWAWKIFSVLSFSDIVAMCVIVCSGMGLSFYVFGRRQAQNPPTTTPTSLSPPQLTWGSEGWDVASRCACSFVFFPESPLIMSLVEICWKY